MDSDELEELDSDELEELDSFDSSLDLPCGGLEGFGVRDGLGLVGFDGLPELAGCSDGC